MYSSEKTGVTPCICTTVRKLSRVLVRAYDAAIGDAGLNIMQFSVLRCIARREGEPLVRVAEELELDRTSLYRTMQPMIRNGWLVQTEGVDARTRSAKLTARGVQVLTQAQDGWKDVQHQVIRRFGREELAVLAGELHRLADCAESRHR